MNLGLEDRFSLRGGSAEDDVVTSASHALNAEALGLEPRSKLLNVVGAEAELIGILLRRQPLVVAGIAVLVQRDNLCVESRLPLLWPLQHKLYVFHRCRRVARAQVLCGCDLAGHRALCRRKTAAINRPRDQRPWRRAKLSSDLRSYGLCHRRRTQRHRRQQPSSDRNRAARGPLGS